MAETAIVNPRRRRRRVYGARRRRRNPETSEANRKHRRRRRNVALADSNRRRRRRRNPEFYGVNSRRRRRRIYGHRSLSRRRNPIGGDIGSMLDDITTFVPPAAAGVIGARWAVRLPGDFPKDGRPGLMQALAIIFWAQFGGRLVGQLFGDTRAAEAAKIAAYGWGGDLFARAYLLSTNTWANANLYMGADEAEALQGLVKEHSLGANPYVVGPDGTVFAVQGLDAAEVPGGYPELMADIGGLSRESPLGFGAYTADAGSSFGYRVRKAA